MPNSSTTHVLRRNAARRRHALLQVMTWGTAKEQAADLLSPADREAVARGGAGANDDAFVDENLPSRVKSAFAIDDATSTAAQADAFGWSEGLSV
jgi:hypothetical protein